MDNIIWWGTEQLSNDRELVDVVLSWEQRLALQHLGEDTSRRPDVNLDIVLLPCKHDLWRSVVSRRNITSHLWVLNAGKAEIANLQVAVLVDKDVGWLEIAVDDTGGVDILQSAENLVQEVLYELLLEWSGGKKTVEISAEELGDEVAGWLLVDIRGKMWSWWHIHILERRNEDVGEGDDLDGCQWCNLLIVLTQLTFSCLRCLRSLSSLYVRLDNTGVLKGFMIFLMATFCPVSWSLAELES